MPTRLRSLLAKLQAHEQAGTALLAALEVPNPRPGAHAVGERRSQDSELGTRTPKRRRVTTKKQST
jgi:hypothetical protein